MGKTFAKQMKSVIFVIVCLMLAAYTQQGAQAVVTQIADMCMNGHNVPPAAQSIVHGAINTAFAAMGRRRLSHMTKAELKAAKAKKKAAWKKAHKGRKLSKKHHKKGRKLSKKHHKKGRKLHKGKKGYHKKGRKLRHHGKKHHKGRKLRHHGKKHHKKGRKLRH